MITSLSGFSPYLTCYIFSFISAFIIPFIVGNFLIDDKKIRVNEVIYSKPVSDIKYILGKFIGTNFAIITICLIVLFSASVIQLSIAVRPFMVYPYITSFFLICLPMILFLTGLVYFLNFTVKNRPLVFLIVVIISFLSIFILNDKTYRLFDFAAVTLPLNPSDIMGYGNINLEIMQRIGYIFAGMSLIFLSAVFPFRLPGTKLLRTKMLIISALTAFISVLLFMIILNNNLKSKQIRLDSLSAHNKYADYPISQVTHYDMNIRLFPSTHRLKADVSMVLSYSENENVKDLIFALNSGLKITKLTDETGIDIPYNREYSIFTIDVKDTHTKKINVSYEGSIDKDSFYLLDERKEKKYIEFAGLKLPEIKWNAGECSSWIGDGCIFLIPESKWYPVPGTDYKENIRISKPANFSTANISVTVPDKYKAVTQGCLTNTEKDKDEIIYFYKTDIPVPQFSINAGKYTVKHTRIDSIDFYAYYSPHHRRYYEFFADTSSLVNETIKELKDWIELETSLKYPYPSFSLVEVPLDLRTYFENYEDFNPMVQPYVIMFPENNINLADARYLGNFNNDQKRAKRTGNEFDISERKKFRFKKILASNLAMSDKFGGRNMGNGDWGMTMLNILTEYWGFQIGSNDRFSSIIRKGINTQVLDFLDGFDDNAYIVNKAQLYDAIETKPLVEFSPEKDGILYDNAMKLKCPAVMKSFCQEIGEEKYKEIISKFLEKYKYKNPSFGDFKSFAEEISDSDFDSFFYQWFNTSHLPGYTITKAESYPLVTNKMETQYQMKVRVKNNEEGRGNIEVIFRTEKDRITRDVPFESFEEKEIGVVVPDKPGRVEVNPIFAKNWSNPRFSYTPSEKPVNTEPYDGIKTVISEKSREIIIDDRDEGFSIVSFKNDRTRIFGQNENESNIKEEFNSFFDAFSSRLKNWTRVYLPVAYGKFRNSLVIKNKGKGKTYAAWKTVIPKDGFYDTYIFINNYTRSTQFFGERIGTVFYVTVVNGEDNNDVEIRTSRNMDGWHYLGEFEYKKGETAEIRLSDKCDGAVIADAAKWVPAE